MRPLTQAEIDRLRFFQDEGLFDEFILLKSDQSQDVYGESQGNTWVNLGTFRGAFTNLLSAEAGDKIVISTYEAELRVSFLLGSQLSSKHRIRVTKIQHIPLWQSREFEIIGEPQLGITCVVLHLNQTKN